MKAKDFGLLAIVFGWTAVLLLIFQQTQLTGQYPIWLMFTTAFFCCGFLASGFLVAGALKRLTER